MKVEKVRKDPTAECIIRKIQEKETMPAANISSLPSKSKKREKSITTKGAGFKIKKRALKYVLDSQTEINIETSDLQANFNSNITTLPTASNLPPQAKFSP